MVYTGQFNLTLIYVHPNLNLGHFHPKQPIPTLPNIFGRILTYQDLSFSKKINGPMVQKFHYETPNIVE